MGDGVAESRIDELRRCRRFAIDPADIGSSYPLGLIGRGLVSEFRRENESRHGFRMIHLPQTIGQQAVVYMEEYALSAGLGPVDSLIAATAIEGGLELATANRKHFVAIPGLRLQVFHPHAV